MMTSWCWSPAAIPSGPRRRAITRITSYRRASFRRRRPRPKRRMTATPTSRFRRPKMIGRSSSSSSRRYRPTPKTPPMPASAASLNCLSTRTSLPHQRNPLRSSTSRMTKPTTTLSASVSCSARCAPPLGRYRSIPPTTWGCDPLRTKHTFRLPPDLAGKLADYAARKRVPQALIVEAALASHLSPDGADRLEAALARRLDRMTRHLERIERPRRYLQRGAGGVCTLLAH